MNSPILNLISANKHLHIVALDKSINQYDCTFFGFIKLRGFRSYCYFTQSQINYLNRFFELKTTNEELSISGKSFKSKKTALDEKYYFNSFIAMNTRRFNNDLIGEKTKFINEYLITPYKENICLSWILTDRFEVVFNEQPFFHIEHITEKNFSYKLYEREKNFLNNFKTYLEYKKYYNIPKEWKDFDLFFEKNKIILDPSDNTYEVNTLLFKSIHFVHKNFMPFIKKFKEYKDIIEYVMENNACFITGATFEDDFLYFTKCFNILCPKPTLKKIKKWKFYYKKLDKTYDILTKMNQVYNIDYEKFDDPLYCYNFYSKKLNEEKYDDYKLPNENKNGYLKFSTDFTNIKLIDDYKIKLVETKKELIKIGSFLHNCAGGLGETEYYNSRLVFVIYQNENKPLYLGTIHGSFLCQLKGFKNSSPPKDLFFNVVEELVKNNIIMKNELTYKLLQKFDDFYVDCCVQKYN